MSSEMLRSIGVVMLAGACFARPALQPFPRECAWGKGTVEASGLPVIRDDIRQCEIGAAELPSAGASRVYAGEEIGNGIYIAVRGSVLAGKLAGRFALDLPAKRQGYALVAEKGCVAVVGHDAIGALYGAETLRQLMADGGKVPEVRIRDWPDYAVRGQMLVWGGINRYRDVATRNKGSLDMVALQAALDEMARHKLNLISTFHSSYSFPEDPALKAQYREFFAYARERGIRGCFVIPQAVFTKHFRPGKEDMGENGKWPCIEYHLPWADLWYCWSRDEETAKAARWWAGYLRGLGATDAYVFIHPRDTGGKDGRDPEEFSIRCARCRARYADDERWKATADQLNIFSRVLKEELPDLEVGSCVQPYCIEILKRIPEDETFKRDTVEFWSKVDKALSDPRFSLSGWACRREYLEEFRRFVPDRPYRFGDTYAQSAGVFMTSARRYGTMYRGGDDERAVVTATINEGKWESMLLAAEYMWNTKAPGCEDFTGTMWYDPLKDHTGPEVVMTTHLPAICRTFWGERIAPAMVEFFSSGVLPIFLANPGLTIEGWNRARKNAMYDPTGGSMGSSGNKVPMPPIIYNAELANGQVAAAEKALKALEAARRYMEEMPVYKRIYFCSYLRRAPYWLATARVQAALLAGREALEAGAPDGGLSRIAAARDTAKRDYDAADVNAKELDSQGFCDNVRFFPYGMLRADAMEALDRAERMAQAGASASGAEGSAGRRGRCVAEAGVRDGRAVDFPVKPTDKSEVWSGERIIDRPTVISRKTLYVMPGTKVVFRGEGRLEVQFGSIYAANADFSADGVMTRNFRIHATRPPKPCWFDNCRFTGMKCEKPGKWGTGFLRLTGSSKERAQLVARHCTFSGCSSVSFQSAGKSEIANCLFENGETGVSALLSLGTFVEGCVFRNMSAVAVTLRQADSTDVVGNVFERCLGGTLFSLSKGCRLIGNSYSDCKPYRVRSNANDNFVAEPLVVNE